MSRLGDVLPHDAHNRELLARVHPPDWRNPEPARAYNLVVVGGGTAGLVTANVAASLGARVALVERHLLGGDCLNVGCVPSKALIRASRMAAEARRAAALGLPLADGAAPDFGAVMERLRRLRAHIAPEDSAQRYRDEVGVDVFLGSARFTGPEALEVDGRTLRFRRAVIATGARAALPPIEGLAEAEPLTNETVFELTERPGHLAVIGGGPIGCELAQAFGRLGTRVTLLSDRERLLPRDDPEAGERLRAALEAEGVELLLGVDVARVERAGSERRVHLAGPDGRRRTVAADALLVAAGRSPNVEDLGLEAAGVAWDPRRGIEVDDRLRTANRRIFAAGDCCMDWKFTHAADAAAKLVVQNALFFGRKRLSALVVPWCTYTDPEVAHVGLTEEDARGRGVELDTWRVPLANVHRAILDGADEGFVKVHVKRGGDRILGATIVGAHAGELISEVTVAMAAKLGLGALTHVIHPYPTQAEGIKAAAGAYTRTRLTPTVRRILERFFAWRR